jgi:two-component system response regulator QseB
MRILLVEDDDLLGDGIQEGLKQEGYAVDWLRDGVQAETALLSETFDAVILDLGLPRKSGIDVLRSIRQQGVKTPVLILTARDALEDRVNGLDAGSDDYLTKPFDFSEVTARLRALIRRSAGRANPAIEIQGVTLDPVAHQVSFSGKPVKLSRREFALLHTLMDNAGKVISRQKIVEALYGWDEEIDSNALEVHIHHLRKKFGNAFIQTIRGIGYIVHKTDENTT